MEAIDMAMAGLVEKMPADTDIQDPITLGDYRLMLKTSMMPWFAVMSDGTMDNMVREVRDWLDVIEAVFEAEPDLPSPAR